MRYDVAIIGSGAAAFAAAITASDVGAEVVMIERGRVGGTCVNVGCVPSKALLAAAATRHLAATQHFPGIATSAGAIDIPLLIAGKNELVTELRAEKYLDLAADYGWHLLRGHATFVAGPALEVTTDDGTQRIEADHYLIATGASPWAPPIEGLPDAGFLTSTTAMELTEIPDSLLVLGGNAVGLEMAQLFARLGSRVTLVEALDRIAPFEEPEISEALTSALADEGITVHTAANVRQVSREGTGYVVHADIAGTPRTLTADRLLVATGRRPNTTQLGLDRIDVKTGDRGEVLVDARQQTNHPRIWAAGDVTGGPQFVYVAAAQGSLAIRNALQDGTDRLDYSALPRVTFTEPSIASAGLTDAQAVAAGYRCECRVLPLSAVPRAIVNRDTRGLVKIVAEADTGRILGVHILAHNAGEVIAAAVYALSARMTVAQIAETWSPYLTNAEALRLAAQAFTRDVSKLSCCAA